MASTFRPALIASAALHAAVLVAAGSIGVATLRPDAPEVAARFEPPLEIADPQPEPPPDIAMPPRVAFDLPPDEPPPHDFEPSLAFDAPVPDDGAPLEVCADGIADPVRHAHDRGANRRFGPARTTVRGDDAPPVAPPGGDGAAPSAASEPDVAPPSGRGDGGARVVARSAPSYPESARASGEEGVVVLSAEVLEDGSVGEVTVVRSSGSRTLDRAARDAVAHWRFEPAISGGAPVRSVLRLPPIRFRLD